MLWEIQRTEFLVEVFVGVTLPSLMEQGRRIQLVAVLEATTLQQFHFVGALLPF